MCVRIQSWLSPQARVLLRLEQIAPAIAVHMAQIAPAVHCCWWAEVRGWIPHEAHTQRQSWLRQAVRPLLRLNSRLTLSRSQLQRQVHCL